MHLTYDQWLERTKLGLLKPRSTSLKGLDEALKLYNQFPSQRHLSTNIP